MTKAQKKEVAEAMSDVWKHPRMKKLLRAQLAASASAGYSSYEPKSAAKFGLKVADEIIRLVGL